MTGTACASRSFPGTQSSILKALARLTGDRSVDTVPLKEVQPLTGYIRGGVTALAGRKNYPVFVDETIDLFDRIAVSAGIRGTQLVLAPQDYIRATGAHIGPLGRPEGVVSRVLFLRVLSAVRYASPLCV